MLEADLIASKAGPVMQVDVHCIAQPMRAAAYTILPPDPGRIDAGPKPRAAEPGARQAGRCDSDGVIVTYREVRDLLASVLCPRTKGTLGGERHDAALQLEDSLGSIPKSSHSCTSDVLIGCILNIMYPWDTRSGASYCAYCH
jgi:hypothetical protein